MTTEMIRPDVADMVLRVFERSVHPELIETLRAIRIQVGRYEATLRLSRHGHSLEFRGRDYTVTEIATSRHNPLPVHQCMVDRRLIGYRTHMIDGRGVRYHCSYQLEAVPAEIYLQIHREMEADARKSTLAIALPGSSTASPLCLSFLRSDLLPEGLVVHSYHTFPDNGAILRIQTLFEILPEVAESEAAAPPDGNG